MSRLFYHVMQDSSGNILTEVSGTMRLAGTGTLATIYGDEAMTVILPNPMTNHPSFGSFKCFLPVGDFDFYMARAGYTFETLTGVQGYGSMAQQEANAVAITGGSANFSGGVNAAAGINVDGTLNANDAFNAGSGGVQVVEGGSARFFQPVAMGTLPIVTNFRLAVSYDKTAGYGIKLRQTGADVGAGQAITFNNVADAEVGGIFTNATATTYNTTSDARLKHDVATLTGELALLQALRPVSFRWNADESPGVGFLAQEVAAHVQGVITGEADAVDEAGGIIPQMIDYSKLVPFLTGAIKTLAAQVESLTARLVVLEDALGI